MLTRMYLYSTSTKLSIDVWLYLDRPGSLRVKFTLKDWSLIRLFERVNFNSFRVVFHSLTLRVYALNRDENAFMETCENCTFKARFLIN